MAAGGSSTNKKLIIQVVGGVSVLTILVVVGWVIYNKGGFKSTSSTGTPSTPSSSSGNATTGGTS